MKLIFETSSAGRKLSILPPCDVPEESLPESLQRQSALHLPEVSENELSRHYTRLADASFGVNDGFYPLGSCTMKYNPKVNEYAASLKGFTDVHPLQPDNTVQGSLEAMQMISETMCEITGMDAFTLQPAAGAHGEFTGLLLFKAYHRSRGEDGRRKIIIPDSAHGTNPASASMCGFEVVSIPSGPDGRVDPEALRGAVGDDTAGLMLTNPNTAGLFEENILEITQIVHEAGGLCYYDGANLNAIMGITRPGDMGFDAVHLNLHKSFSTPHGGGGPGSGIVGCRDFLAPFLPGDLVQGSAETGWTLSKAEHSVGSMKMFHGNFLVIIRALAYLLTLGKEGIPEVAENAVLNANYMRVKLSDLYEVAFEGTCMHEFVLTLEKLAHDTGCNALDIAKGLIDLGIHPPTMYFPLIIHEALMIEPTETESKEELDAAIHALRELWQKAHDDPESLHTAPHHARIGRPDEVQAARKPVLRFAFGADHGAGSSESC